MGTLYGVFLACGAVIGVMLSSCSGVTRSKRSRTGLVIEGDIVIGGLIPVHFSPNFAPHPGAATCRGAFHLRGYKGVEAMLFAVHLINNNPNLLPNVTLGVDIKDTCGSVDYAIMECLNFDFIRSAFTASESIKCTESKENLTGNKFTLPGSETVNKSLSGPEGGTALSGGIGSDYSCCSSKPRTVAIVGAAFSGVTMAIASLAGLFHVPVVSYASSSRLLSDRSRFRYFFRTVPSDKLQAQAVSDILHLLKWHFIIALASDNEYGRSGITALKQSIQSREVQQMCIVVDELFSRKGSREDMLHIFNKIRNFPQAKVIILYSEFPDAKYFFEEARRASLVDYMFIASDSWVASTEVTQRSEGVFHSIIGLRPPIAHMPQFDSYFMEKLLKNNSKNPWVYEFEKSFSCQQNNSDKCYSEVHDNGYVPYIVDAVFSVAHALHAMLNCNTRSCAKRWSDIELRDLRDFPQFMQNVSFAGYSQQRVYFDENGCTGGQYDIYHMKKGSNKYMKVGRWSENASPRLNLSRISLDEVPASICSSHCKKGEYKIPKSQFPECCWECVKCEGKSYTNTSHTTNCMDCPNGTWPTADHSQCSPIAAYYLQWSESWAVVIVMLSTSGLAVVLLTIVVFIKFRETAVVRAASRQLCYFLLAGIAMFYVTPLPYVTKPSAVSCKLLPFMIGLCFVLVVGTILVRTNRVSRIFNEKLLRTGTIGCIGNHWQLLILGCLLTIELVVCFVWVYGSSSPPIPEVIYHQASKHASLVCNLSGSDIGFSLWLIYNAGLIVVCTYQAFLVRKVPQNYNESKLIAFNMTTICITVLVYIPSYMGTTGWYRTVISSFMFLFLGTLTWASIFAPKIYIIFFRPHKNIPMRPSVSSITLGVITPSPTVVSNLSDQCMRSRSNSSLPEVDDAFDFGYDHAGVESWDGLWGNFSQSGDTHDTETSSQGYIRESRKTSTVRFEDEVFDCSEKPFDQFEDAKTENSTDHIPPVILARSEDLTSQTPGEDCENEGKRGEEMSKKRTSVVHFEDDDSKNNVVNQSQPPLVRKQSNYGTQGGILRRKESCIGEEPGTSSPNKEIRPRKNKKTSLVRFKDEVTSHEFHDTDSYSVSELSPSLPTKGEVLDEFPGNQISYHETTNKENISSTRETGKDSDLSLLNADKNGSVDMGRKRKISVYQYS